MGCAGHEEEALQIQTEDEYKYKHKQKTQRGGGLSLCQCLPNEKRRIERPQVEMWGVSVCPLPWTGMFGWGHKARRQIHRSG